MSTFSHFITSGYNSECSNAVATAALWKKKHVIKHCKAGSSLLFERPPPKLIPWAYAPTNGILINPRHLPLPPTLRLHHLPTYPSNHTCLTFNILQMHCHAKQIPFQWSTGTTRKICTCTFTQLPNLVKQPKSKAYYMNHAWYRCFYTVSHSNWFTVNWFHIMLNVKSYHAKHLLHHLYIIPYIHG